MKIIKATIIFLLMLILSVNALEIFDTQCKNDGSLKLVLKADSNGKIYTEDIVVKVGQIVMQGTWDTFYLTKSSSASREYSTFQSEENMLTAERSYPINIEYKLTDENDSKTPGTMSLEVECTGFVFSCRNLNISIESCENQQNGLFRAVLNVNGLEQSETAKMDIMQVVDFVLEAENKYTDMTGRDTSRGALPLKAQVLRIEKDKYVIRYEFSSKHNNTIQTLWAGYNKNLRYPCEEDKYPEVGFYDNVECTKEEPIESEEKEDAAVQTGAVQQQETEKQAENKKTAEQILREQPKNYRPLAIISIILITVLSVGGIILSYLYRRGYL